MEKSIETIWKEGFLNSDAIMVPKITDLYNQKSKLVTERFKRMFKINLIAIAVFSIGVLVLAMANGFIISGLLWFLILIGIAAVNKILMNGLQRIDPCTNSYDYLILFNKWLQEQLSVNRKMAQFYYPFLFLSFVFGIWFIDAEGLPLGERLVGEILYGFPDIYLINGVPLIVIFIITVIVGLLALFGGKIYNLDVKIVYGRMFKKIEELIADLEELKK